MTVQGLVRNEKAGWEYILKEIHLEAGSGKNEGKILPGDAVLAVLSFSEKDGLRVETAAEGTDNYTITYIPGRLIILPGPAEVPKTGDPAFPLAWLMTVLLGAAGIMGLLLARKKK